MTNQPLPRDPHRYQPEDQFQDPPAPTMAEPTSQETYVPPEPTPAAPSINQEAMAQMPKPEAEKVLVEWDALSRPHKKRHKQYYVTVSIILGLIAFILFAVGQFLPIAVVLAIGFLFYVLEMVPPTKVHHAISTYGFRVEGNLYYWDEIGRFWFTERHDYPLLHLEIDRFPNRLTVLIGDISEELMTTLLTEILIHEQPPLTPIEKGAAWLEKMLPLEPSTPKQ